MNLFALLGLAAQLAAAQPAPPPAAAAPASELHGIVAWLQKQELRAGTHLSLEPKARPVGYLRGLSFGQKGLDIGAAGAEAWLDLDPGITTDDKDRPEVLALLMFHPAAIGRRLYAALPFKDRIRYAGLPELEIGPALRFPRDAAQLKAWRGRDNIGFVVSMRVF